MWKEIASKLPELAVWSRHSKNESSAVMADETQRPDDLDRGRTNSLVGPHESVGHYVHKGSAVTSGSRMASRCVAHCRSVSSGGAEVRMERPQLLFIGEGIADK